MDRWDRERSGLMTESAPLFRELDVTVLPGHMNMLYLAARSLCRSREDAEDLVQETFARVLKRPRLLRSDDDRGYLLRALRNTHTSRYRTAMRRPITVPLPEADFGNEAA